MALRPTHRPSDNHPDPLGLASKTPTERISAIVAADDDDGEGATRFGIAAMTGNATTVRAMLAGGKIQLSDEAKSTALYLAIQYGLHKEDPDGGLTTVRVLLEAGANPNVMGSAGETPLLVAAEAGNVEAVKLLIDHEADVTYKAPDGRTSMEAASESGRLRIQKMLRDAEAEVDK